MCLGVLCLFSVLCALCVSVLSGVWWLGCCIVVCVCVWMLFNVCDVCGLCCDVVCVGCCAVVFCLVVFVCVHGCVCLNVSVWSFVLYRVVL